MSSSSIKKKKVEEGHVIRLPLESAEEILELFKEYQRDKIKLSRLSSTQLSDAKKNLSSLGDDPRALLSLATIYELEDDTAKAVSILEGLVQRHRNASGAYVQLISLYESQGDYEKAIDAYDRVGTPKYAICLRKLPRSYQEFLVCGITSQNYFNQILDERVDPKTDADFSFLRKKSVIRLGFLSWVPIKRIKNVVGKISPERHKRLLEKLAIYIHPIKKP